MKLSLRDPRSIIRDLRDEGLVAWNGLRREAADALEAALAQQAEPRCGRCGLIRGDMDGSDCPNSSFHNEPQQAQHDFTEGAFDSNGTCMYCLSTPQQRDPQEVQPELMNPCEERCKGCTSCKQAQPEMPTREMIVNAIYPDFQRTLQGPSDQAMLVCGFMADAVLALFAPKETA